MSDNLKGKNIINVASRTLMASKELLILPIVSFFILLFSFIPFIIILYISEANSNLQNFLFILMSLLASFISSYFSVAFAIGADQSMDGINVRVKDILIQAWERKFVIFQWSIITVTVGLILRIIKERFPRIGDYIEALGGMAWSVATYFVIPVLAFSNKSGWDAVRESSSILKDKFGKVVRVEGRITLRIFGLALLAFLISFFGFYSGNTILSLLLLTISILLVVGGIIFFQCISAIARVALYRYVNGKDVPGFDPVTLNTTIKTN